MDSMQLEHRVKADKWEKALYRFCRTLNVAQGSSGIFCESTFHSVWSKEHSHQNELAALVKMQILVPTPRPKKLKSQRMPRNEHFF